MIASWMLYMLLVGVLIASAACMLAVVCRLVGWPMRWAWLGALLAILGLVGRAPLRVAAPEVTLLAPSLAIPETSDAASAPEPLRWPSLLMSAQFVSDRNLKREELERMRRLFAQRLKEEV